MTTGIDNPDIEGTLEDLKLTDKQKEVFNVIAYFSKISMAIENSEGQIYNEKPNGFQEFIKKVSEVDAFLSWVLPLVELSARPRLRIRLRNRVPPLPRAPSLAHEETERHALSPAPARCEKLFS